MKQLLIVVLLAGFPMAADAQAEMDTVEASGMGTKRTKRRSRRRRPRIVTTRRGAPRLRVVAEVRTSVQPKSVEVSPDGRYVWVCNFGRIDQDNVYVYNADTLDRVGVVNFPGNAVETTFSPDGATAYISNFRRGVIEVVDTASYTVQREIEVGANPKFMVISPDGKTLYAALYTQRRVALVDLETGTRTRYLPTGEQPRGMAMLPNGSFLVASFRSDFIQVFAPNGDELRRFNVCDYPRHLQVGPGAERVAVTCTMGNISTYDIATGHRRVIARTGRNPRTLGLSQDGRWAATANFHSSDVTLADLATLTHRTSSVDGANQLVGLAVRLYENGPDAEPRLRIYATSWQNRRLFVLEPTGPLPPLPAE